MDKRSSGHCAEDRLLMRLVEGVMARIGSYTSSLAPSIPAREIIAASPSVRGFTIIELVVVIVIIGILAVSAIPRFDGRNAFDARGYHDQVVMAVQYARQQAIAQRRQMCVNVSAAGQLTVTRALAPAPGVCGATTLLNPATNAAYDLRPPASVVIAGVGATALPLVLAFDALGRPNGAAVLSVTGDGVRCLSVAAGTGYVRGYFAPC